MTPNSTKARLGLLLALLPFTCSLCLSGCTRAEHTDYSAFAPAEDKRLTIYASSPKEVYAPIIREFEERTGIWVEVEDGDSAALLKQIAAESEDPRCDVILGGSTEGMRSHQDCFSSYISTEAEYLPSEYMQADGLWTPFSLSPIVLIYNPKLVRANPPSGWNSLLDPAWKGKIAFADPEISESGCMSLSIMAQILPGIDEDLIRRFYENLEGRTTDQIRQVTGEVANGRSFIGVTLEENALRGIAKGYDIAIVYPNEGTGVIPDGIAVIAGCPHEQNARLFVDFALSKDVQTYLSRFSNLRTVRNDVPPPDGETEELLTFSHDAGLSGGHPGNCLTLWRILKEEVQP